MGVKELILYVYNKSFQLVGLIDQYYSLIWSDRYNQCGDFELKIPYQSSTKSIFKKDYYCRIDYSDHTMIVEQIMIQSSTDGPATLIVTGRSLESILERRIVLAKKEFGKRKTDGTFDLVSIQDSIRELFDENIISPTNNSRAISNFKFEKNFDQKIVDLKFQEVFDKDNLLNIVQDICEEYHIGFKIIQNKSNQFVFSFYIGTDRSRFQNTNTYVIFSPYYDNIKSSNWFTSNSELKNVMYVSLEKKYTTNSKGERIEVKRSEYFEVPKAAKTDPSGLNRREIHVNEQDLKEKYETELTDTQCKLKARKKLNNTYKEKTGFEAELVEDMMYTYRKHYFVGDRVFFEDVYGNSETLYIPEVVISFDESGLSIVPTFEEIDWDE